MNSFDCFSHNLAGVGAGNWTDRECVVIDLGVTPKCITPKCKFLSSFKMFKFLIGMFKWGGWNAGLCSEVFLYPIYTALGRLK